MCNGQVEIPRDCEAIGSCVDYHAYAFQLPRQVDPAAWQLAVKGLLDLGRPQQYLQGVTRVAAPWGFLVIPPQNFPELRINFFHQTDKTRQSRVLSRIAGILSVLRET